MTRATRPAISLGIGAADGGTLILRQLMPISERKEDPSRQRPVDLTFDGVVADEVGYGGQFGVPSGQDCGGARHTLGPLSSSR